MQWYLSAGHHISSGKNVSSVFLALLLLRFRGDRYLAKCERTRSRVAVGKGIGTNRGKKISGVGDDRIRWYRQVYKFRQSVVMTFGGV